MNTYGQELNRRLGNKQLPARVLAQKLGKSTSFVSDLGNDKKANIPDAWVLRIIARELDWPVTDQLMLFGYLEPGDLESSDDSQIVRELTQLLRRIEWDEGSYYSAYALLSGLAARRDKPRMLPAGPE